MKQATKKTTSTDKTVGVVSALKKEFEEVQATPLTRNVILITESCCGCGCHDIKIQRTVPYNSPLKDGDKMKGGFQKGDKQVD